jgi:hypothetical protein
MLFSVGHKRFQFYLDLLYVINFVLLSVTILLGYTTKKKASQYSQYSTVEERQVYCGYGVSDV